MSYNKKMESKIKKAREQENMSRADLSRLLGVPYRTVERWENGDISLREWVETMVLFCIAEKSQFALFGNTLKQEIDDRVD